MSGAGLMNWWGVGSHPGASSKTAGASVCSFGMFA
jgi:hypothetical protein